MKFRSDINGLRAWAVVGVVLFHFDVPGFAGGFAGVDVFFVISGFLMTAIIVDALTARRFAVGDFFLARARRILPALAALCVALLIAGWFLLPFFDYATLGKHVAHAISFKSNVTFFREAGYFDTASHEKWLLHTWSLSVEWQFYLLLPWLLWLAWRIRPTMRMVAGTLALCATASFAASAWLTAAEPSAAFYLLHSRCWELVAGGLVFVMKDALPAGPAVRRSAEVGGFGLVLGSMLLLQPQVAWPGGWAAIPVAGAMMIIWAARVDSWGTNSRLFQTLGNASYSIYLWHWPIAAALHYFSIQTDGFIRLMGVSLSLLLGFASYRIVEKPSQRFFATLSKKKAWLVLLLIFLAVLAAGRIINSQKGVPGRLSASVERIFAAAKNTHPRLDECMVEPPKEVPECRHGGEKLGAIVIGDSHAGSVMGAVQKSLGAPERYVLDWSFNSCPTLLGIKVLGVKRADACGKFLDQALDRSEALDPTVPLIIVNRSSTYLYGPNDQGRESESGQPRFYFDTKADRLTPELIQQFKQSLKETVCRFAKDRPVYLIRPIPELIFDVPRTMGRYAIFHDDSKRVSISMDEYAARNRIVWEAQDAAGAQCGARILNPLPYLCQDGRCWGDRDGMPLYYDDDHLNEQGAALLMPMFREVFARPH